MAKRKPPVVLMVKIEYSPCPDYENRMRRVIDMLMRSYFGEGTKKPPKEQKGNHV